jgi:DNA-binding LacI/PurR family transcriptional regulator
VARKKTFVLVIPRFEALYHAFYAGEIIKGASLSASRLNADILLHITDRFDHKSWLDPAYLDRQVVTGVMFADIDNDIKVVKKVIERGMPCMVLNNMLSQPMNCVSVDNKSGTREIVEYLLESGHRDIATITGDLSTQAGALRLSEFKDVLREKKIRLKKSFVQSGNFLRTPARRAAERLLKEHPRPTAIFAASDVMALEVLDAAKSMNIAVPDELSVVGFDDNPVNAASRVPLTTVAQPLVEMGRLGLEYLDQISRGKAKLPVKELLKMKFIKRKSVRLLKSG